MGTIASLFSSDDPSDKADKSSSSSEESDDAGVPENELPPKPEQTGEKQTDSASAGVVQSDDAAASSDASSKPKQTGEKQTDSASAGVVQSDDAAASSDASSKPEQKEEEQADSGRADVPTFLVTFVQIRVIAADVSALGDKKKMTEPSIYCKIIAPKEATPQGPITQTPVVSNDSTPSWQVHHGTFGFAVNKPYTSLVFGVELMNSEGTSVGRVTFDASQQPNSHLSGTSLLLSGSVAGTINVLWQSGTVVASASAAEISGSQLDAAARMTAAISNSSTRAAALIERQRQKDQAAKDAAAAIKAEEERLAAEKAKAEAKAAAERLAAIKAEEERVAAEKAEAERIAAAKAEAERLAAIKAEEEARAKAEAERLAKKKAEAERIAAEQAEAARKAAEAAKAAEEAARKAKAEREEAEAKAAEEAAAAKAGAAVVQRRELRRMNRADQERFMDALLTMMKNKDGKPGTNEYFRVAGFHGWPEDYCAHRQESFPAWHRAYLKEIETALQEADRANGNDGLIGLPYWDWMVPEINGEVLPGIVREKLPKFLREIIPGPGGAGGRLYQRGYSRIKSDAQIRMGIYNNRLHDQVYAALDETLHWKHASTRHGGDSSVEAPHNSMHVILGWPLSSLQFAAFHPSFFLHHCNIDRIYEGYLKVDSDAQQEFVATQQSLAGRWGETNRYLQPLNPFKHPKTGKPFTCADTFDTAGIGYEYDRVPAPRPPQMRQLPTLALFEAVNVVAFKGNSYMLHVFVLPLGDENIAKAATIPGGSGYVAKKPSNKSKTDRVDPTKWFPPGMSPSADGKGTKCAPNVSSLWSESDHALYSDNYAGAAGIFGGKGPDCANCLETEPVNITVDITTALNRLGVSRHEIAVVCFVEDPDQDEDAGAYMTRLDGSNIIPLPKVTGPLFENMDSSLQNHNFTAGQYAAENAALQRYLKATGHYESGVDGWFGQDTENSVKKFQKFNKLRPDGIVGGITKTMIMSPRNDFHPDKPGLKWPYADRRFDESVSELVVNVGVVPGYLPRSGTIDTISVALRQWEEAIGGALKIRVVKELGAVTQLGKHQRSVTIDWCNKYPSAEGLDITFGAVGGCLAHAEPGKIFLDSAEHWLLPNSKRKARGLQYSLLAVVVHEMGHVLGLAHSKIPADVMSPYYVENRTVITARDAKRAKDLYTAQLSRM